MYYSRAPTQPSTKVKTAQLDFNLSSLFLYFRCLFPDIYWTVSICVFCTFIILSLVKTTEPSSKSENALHKFSVYCYETAKEEELWGLQVTRINWWGRPAIKPPCQAAIAACAGRPAGWQAADCLGLQIRINVYMYRYIHRTDVYIHMIQLYQKIFHLIHTAHEIPHLLFPQKKTEQSTTQNAKDLLTCKSRKTCVCNS